ncbi:MAG: hypothetical protein ACLR6S_01505 [Lacrimispora saccharolytica]
MMAGYYFLCSTHMIPQKISVLIPGILPVNFGREWYLIQILTAVLLLMGVIIMEKIKYVYI